MVLVVDGEGVFYWVSIKEKLFFVVFENGVE